MERPAAGLAPGTGGAAIVTGLFRRLRLRICEVASGSERNRRSLSNSTSFGEEEVGGPRMDDRGEFLTLFLRHQTDLRAFIGSLLRDRHARDDVFQEVALALW